MIRWSKLYTGWWHRRILLIFSFLLGSLALAACAGGNYGHLKDDALVTLDFKDHKALANHTYYYHGYLGLPAAIVGIEDSYTFDPGENWTKVDFSKIAIRDLVDAMERKETDAEFAGSHLTDPDGNWMGVWFSNIHSAEIRMKGPRQIEYITPVEKKPRGK